MDKITEIAQETFCVFTLFAHPLTPNAHSSNLSLKCIKQKALQLLTISDHRAFLVIFRLRRSDIFATQKRYCRLRQ